MTRCVAFLRAINVGGHTVKMDALRLLFESVGFSGVETFIASGNVVFEARGKDTRTMETKIERHLRASLGYEVPTFIRSMEEISGIARSRPFPASELDAAGHALYVYLLGAEPSPEAQGKVLGFRCAEEDFCIQGREVYRLYRRRFSESTLTGPQFEKALGMQATARNITTMRRLAAKYPVPRVK